MSLLFYNPRTNNRQALLLRDSNAYLSFNGTSLVSSTTGLRLTTGTLVIDDTVQFANSAITLSQAITFGDGNPLHDLNVFVKPGARLEVLGGLLNYENTQ